MVGAGRFELPTFLTPFGPDKRRRPLASFSGKIINQRSAQGKLDDAISEYHSALRLNFNPEEVTYNLAKAHSERGDVYKKIGNLDAAITEYKETLKMNPDIVNTRYNLENVYAKKGNYSEALKWLQEFIDVAPADYNSFVAQAKNNVAYLKTKL